MKLECNSYQCIRCNNLITFTNKRKFNNFAGCSCPKCSGEVLPVYVGIDLVHTPQGVDRENYELPNTTYRYI